MPEEASVALRGARVLLTGATGFIGSHVAQRLLANGVQLAATRRQGLVETLRKLPAAFRKYEIEWHQVDLRTFGAVSHMIASIRPDLVLHLAAAGVTDPFLSPDAAIRANVYGTINLLRAIGGRARVVVARTPGELDAMNVYAASKAAAWSFCQMYHRTEGWPLVGVMPFQTYGAWQTQKALVASTIRAALNGDDMPLTHGEQQRDWVYIDDVVDAFLRAAVAENVEGETLEVGNGQTASVREVVELIYSLVEGKGKPLIGVLPTRPGEMQYQVADVNRTEALIGWRAKVTLDEGLQETIRWERKQSKQTVD